MKGKYKNKKLIKDNLNDETNTQSVSYIEVPVELYKKDTKTRYSIRRAIAPAIILVLVLFVGIFLIIYGAKPSLFRDKNLVSTQATVVKYEWRENNHSATDRYHSLSPHPIYNYEFDGEEYTVEGRVAVNPPPFKVGEEITIYVNPDDPTEIWSPIANKFCIIFGSIMIGLSLLVSILLALQPLLVKWHEKSYWAKFVTLYIPIMLFSWGIAIFFATQCINSSGIRNGAVGVFILMLACVALATFISVIMIKDMVVTIRNHREEKANKTK